MRYNVQNSEFEQALEDNLSTYTTITPDTFNSDINLFSTRREISIARYALSSQAIAYQAAMELLMSQLDFIKNNGINDKSMFSNIMTLLAGIENKSRSLIDSAIRVTELLGRAVEIDVDKAALRTLLINAPSLLEKTITQVSGDSELASAVSLSFNSKINELMIAFRLDRHNDNLSSGGISGNGSGQAGITLNEMSQLMGSVPSSQPVGSQADSYARDSVPNSTPINASYKEVTGQ